MQQIHFHVPDNSVARRFVNKLFLPQTKEKHIHIISKLDTPLEEQSKANLLQKSNFIPSVQQGLTLNGSGELLAGLIAFSSFLMPQQWLQVAFCRQLRLQERL